LGVYGHRVEKRAWLCLERGAVDFMSSDYHAKGKCGTAAARHLLEECGGREHFRLLTTVNGRRLLEDADPVPVPPLARISRWRRVKAVFRLTGTRQ
jgi:hypothetical protein